MSYTTLGITDSVNVCDCCGKSNLKQTVAMQSDCGDLVHFGTVCATRHSGRDSKTIRKEVKDIETAKNTAAMKEYRSSSEYAAEQAKFAEAHRIGVTPGKPFREFTRAASDAAHAKSHEIALKHGVQYLAA